MLPGQVSLQISTEVTALLRASQPAQTSGGVQRCSRTCAQGCRRHLGCCIRRDSLCLGL